MDKKIIYIDMDGVLCDYYGALAQALKTTPEQAYPQAEYGFFANLAPIAGAIDAVNRLRHSDKYDVYILTAPSIENPMCYAEKRVWIETYFDMDLVANLIICGHKHLLMGDYLIDDNTCENGQDKFSGTFIHFREPSKTGWKKVMKLFFVEMPTTF